MQRLFITTLMAILFAAATTAQTMTMDTLPAQRRTPAYDVTRPDLDAITSRAARRGLASAFKGYRRAVIRVRKAATDRSATRRARGQRDAARTFEAALRRVKRIEKSVRNDIVAAAVAGDLRARIAASARVTHLRLAAAYTSRSSYKRALDAVEAALRLDPDDREAAALLRHVQLVTAAASRRR